MAVAPLRPDRAARPLRRREFPEFCRSPSAAIRSGPCGGTRSRDPGRFRQFTQFDADTVGASSVAADAELCMLAADTLEALGVQRGQYVIKVNNRKVLDGVLEPSISAEMPILENASPCCGPSTNSTALGLRVFARCWARAARTKAATSPKGLAESTQIEMMLKLLDAEYRDEEIDVVQPSPYADKFRRSPKFVPQKRVLDELRK